jgi:hypothetical protein
MLLEDANTLSLWAVHLKRAVPAGLWIDDD